MSAAVRVVPVTPAAFERAAARDGAGPLERLRVADDLLGLPITIEGLLQPGGHYLMRHRHIGERLSGRRVLTFKRYVPEGEPFTFYSFGWQTLAPSVARLYMGGNW
jgi:hypothetical protein